MSEMQYFSLICIVESVYTSWLPTGSGESAGEFQGHAQSRANAGRATAHLTAATVEKKKIHFVLAAV